MLEGWHQEQHFILFDSDDAEGATERYKISESLPGFVVVGLRGWDDFILRDKGGELFVVPTVPATAEYLESFGQLPSQVLSDHLRSGLIKWYAKPLVFGGTPEAEENVIWVDHRQHAELVVWWNRKYRQLTVHAAESGVQRQSRGATVRHDGDMTVRKAGEDEYDEQVEFTPLSSLGRIVGGLIFAVLAVIGCLTAVVGLTESFASRPAGRAVAFVLFGSIGIACSWFAIRLLLNWPRSDGGLMSPLALRCAGSFFIVLTVASLTAGAWRNNSIPLVLVVLQGGLYVWWGISLWRLAGARKRMR